jgi:hypothetical protein
LPGDTAPFGNLIKVAPRAVQLEDGQSCGPSLEPERVHGRAAVLVA